MLRLVLSVTFKLSFYTFTAMEEVLLEGKNFRLVDELELPEIIEFLGNYLPDSLKVSF